MRVGEEGELTIRGADQVYRGPRRPAGRMAIVALAVLLALATIAGACSGPAAPPPSGTASGATSPNNEPSAAASAVADAALPVHSTRVADVRLAWCSLGTGPPLVLIMGLGGTLDVWSPPFLRALSRDYTIIVFDNRGMGRSADGRRPVTIETMADDTASLMRKLGYREYGVLGFSMGSLVAQEVALRFPGRVRALVLYATTPGGREAVLDARAGSGAGEAGGTPDGSAASPAPQPSAGTAVASLFDLARRLFPEEYRRAHPNYLDLVPKPRSLSDVRGFGRQIGALAAWRGSWTRLPRLRMPVLLLSGAEDELTPPVNAVRMATRIPQSWLVRIAGGGHGVMYQYPQRVARVVTTFLSVNGYEK
jgi:pimeloyl-ACP methyl ester carboxylesterase